MKADDWQRARKINLRPAWVRTEFQILSSKDNLPFSVVDSWGPGMLMKIYRAAIDELDDDENGRT